MDESKRTMFMDYNSIVLLPCKMSRFTRTHRPNSFQFGHIQRCGAAKYQNFYPGSMLVVLSHKPHSVLVSSSLWNQKIVFLLLFYLKNDTLIHNLLQKKEKKLISKSNINNNDLITRNNHTVFMLNSLPDKCIFWLRADSGDILPTFKSWPCQ